MESWNYVSVSQGKGFAFDETVLPSNTATKGRNFDMFWELKTPSSYEDQGFGELDFPGMTPKRLIVDSLRNGSKFCSGDMIVSPLMDDPALASPMMAIQNPFSGEAESRSRLSSSAVESNSRESSLIDLKLGGFTDCMEAPNCYYNSKENPNSSSPEPTTLTKTVQAANLNSQTPFCLVLGCNKDLNASKGYHKRHKVCEVHSKAAKVVVNGIEQRFCQQCSRFHLLGDFDNGKRSCRKRLACHNERRRKPKAGISSRTGRFLQPNDGGIFSENSNHYLHDLGPQNSVSLSLFHNTSQKDREDLLFFDTASSFQAFPGVPESGCALSLLSSQSREVSMHSMGTSLTSSMIVPTGHVHNNVGQVSRRNSGVCPQTSIGKPLSNVFPPIGMSCAEGNHVSSFLLTDGDRGARSFEVSGGVFQGSDSMNGKDWFSCEDGATIDLLQLSSQLQQVEHQKHSLQVKQENDAFCCLKIT